MARASVHEATGEGDVGAKTTGPTSESPKIGGMVAPNLVQVQHFLRQCGERQGHLALTLGDSGT
ncbi:MAG: hypothetical protein DMG96_24175 [Acidobacteria bacterium]|nr:MAG: hypothetical protein DMG96_24175 [Acidobacteriota bacterium]